MKHPTREEWMAYLYQETPPEPRSEQQRHLDACAECRALVDGFQATLRQLDGWRLSEAAPRSQRSWAALKWAVAALFLLTIGWGVGQLSAPRGPDLQTLTAQLLPSLRAQLRQEFQDDLHAALAGQPTDQDSDFRRQVRAELNQWASATLATSAAETQRLLASFARVWDAAREEDRRSLMASMASLHEQHRADYLVLRRLVETVAVVSEDRYQRSQGQIGYLAALTRTESSDGAASDRLVPPER